MTKLTHTYALVAGIESDIKLWSPTAEEAHPPGREAEEIMEMNRSDNNQSTLNGHPMMLSSQLIAQILRMQHLPVVRTRRYAAILLTH